jgi:hypothetical protein
MQCNILYRGCGPLGRRERRSRSPSAQSVTCQQGITPAAKSPLNALVTVVVVTVVVVVVTVVVVVIELGKDGGGVPQYRLAQEEDNGPVGLLGN